MLVPRLCRLCLGTHNLVALPPLIAQVAEPPGMRSQAEPGNEQKTY